MSFIIFYFHNLINIVMPFIAFLGFEFMLIFRIFKKIVKLWNTSDNDFIYIIFHIVIVVWDASFKSSQSIFLIN